MSTSLVSLFSRALSEANKASKAPTIEDSTQAYLSFAVNHELLRSSLSNLRTVKTRISELALFSPNETLDDISSKDLVYLFVDYVVPEVRGKVRTAERGDRLRAVKESQVDLRSFLSTLEQYEIVPEEERSLHTQNASSVVNAAKRRELKIKQYQKVKDLKARIEVARKRRGLDVAQLDGSPTELELIASLLPNSERATKPTPEDEDLDADTDEVLREATLLLLRLCYAHAHNQLESLEQEAQLLSMAPPSPPRPPQERVRDERGKAKEKQDDMWRLDMPQQRSGPDGKGPLMDSSGKPLRPFTILPSDAGKRAQLQAQVFGPGYNLPTMSVDEYLQIEKERGNIITGGGPASEAAPTSSEQLALDAEMDGTAEGEAKAEEKRLKDEKWAQYTDANPKGAGNTMNRG